MPFVRFTRDRRGYEHTYLLHFDPRKGRGHARLLFWHRSPPGVRVGRPTFDPDTRRLIERAHPDVIFDWVALETSLANTVGQLAQASADAVRRPPRKKKAAQAPPPV